MSKNVSFSTFFFRTIPCQPYMDYGNEGCDKGEDCKNFHPVLCEVALKTGSCWDKTCTLPHVKGRKRENDSKEQNELKENEHER